MTKNVFAILVACFLFSACSSDDKEILPGISTELDVQIANLSNKLEVAQEDTLFVKAVIHSKLDSEFKWLVNGKVIEEAKDSVFKFVQDDLGEYTISLKGTNKETESIASVKVNVFGKYRDGTFILNEGNMTTENGSLIFISPNGQITDSVYYKENGSELGNVAQDLFITNNRLYIISQNGSKNTVGTSFANEGMLVIANAETLKNEASYDVELAETLSWASHIAVLGQDNVYIRDNKGLYLFNTTSKELTFVEGSKGTNKSTMAVVGNYLFAAAGKKLLAVKSGETEIAFSKNFEQNISAVIPSYDDKLWVSTGGTSPVIYKLNPINLDIIRQNNVTVGRIDKTYASSPAITAKGDTIYYSNLSTKIYRHIFNEGTSELMVDAKSMVENAGVVYNTIAVHPKTGHVYLNTMKGFGWDFLINEITLFDFDESEPKVVHRYNNYTHLPVGVFFTDNFRK